MSWNTKFIAKTKKAAQVALLAEPNMPLTMKNAISAVIEERASDDPIIVESDGHIDSHSGYGKFSVTMVKVVE